jgi:16S rRNA (uracil1498-N3)-methyltransferase
VAAGTEDPVEGFAADMAAVAHTFVPALTDSLEIDGDDGHHLARVRRLAVGEALTAADGSGRWRAYEIDAVGRGSVSLVATDSIRHEPGLVPALHVVFALTKGEKPETVVRQLTELGVDSITPVIGERSVVRVRGERGAALTDRLRRVAREAACQSRRARITTVEDVTKLGEVVDAPGLVVAERCLGGPERPDRPVQESREGWRLVVGPEGGFAPAEDAALAGAPRVAVGPYVLRAETAAVAAAAVLTARRRSATP